jgi:hypothetical protein
MGSVFFVVVLLVAVALLCPYSISCVRVCGIFLYNIVFNPGLITGVRFVSVLVLLVV